MVLLEQVVTITDLAALTKIQWLFILEMERINTAKDKNPFMTSQYAVYSGSSWYKGRSYIWASGANTYIRTCWNDGCGTNDRQQDTIPME